MSEYSPCPTRQCIYQFTKSICKQAKDIDYGINLFDITRFCYDIDLKHLNINIGINQYSTKCNDAYISKIQKIAEKSIKKGLIISINSYRGGKFVKYEYDDEMEEYEYK